MQNLFAKSPNLLERVRNSNNIQPYSWILVFSESLVLIDPCPILKLLVLTKSRLNIHRNIFRGTTTQFSKQLREERRRVEGRPPSLSKFPEGH